MEIAPISDKPNAEVGQSEDVTREDAVEYHIDPDEDAHVRRWIDYFIMPAMVLVVFFQFVDKQSINYAAVFGLNEALDLTGSDSSWAVSLFYFG